MHIKINQALSISRYRLKAFRRGKISWAIETSASKIQMDASGSLSQGRIKEQVIEDFEQRMAVFKVSEASKWILLGDAMFLGPSFGGLLCSDTGDSEIN